MSSKKSLKQRNETTFEGRIIIAFNGRSLKEIAEIVDEKEKSFWNWATERTEMPHSVLAKIAEKTDVSLNWNLTGKGIKNIPKEEIVELIDKSALADFVRKIVREEIARSKGRPTFTISGKTEERE